MFKFILAASLLAAVFQSKAETIILTENNSVLFNQSVTQDYASKKTLEILAKAAKTSPIYLVLDTPGGSVISGLQFVDAIKASGAKVHTITIFAASMGYQIVQELGTRYIIESGTLMSHRGSVSGMSGQIPGELTSRINFLQSLLDGMSERASKRVGMSKPDYDAAIVNELWSYGKNAVDTNQADKIANVRCSKELLAGQTTQKVNTIFGQVNLVFSKCPIITSPISVEFSNNVKFEDMQKAKNQLLNQRRRGFLTL
jgi:ATP-dependent protease ClpP protease subunit